MSNFKIYNASAGSGKTYTLVKEVLVRLLQDSNPSYFESVLAITFTNKAANEMKSRLLEWLLILSENPNHKIAKDINQNLDLELEVLQERSRRILSKILHNYSRLSMSTIDKFNLKLTKSFAKDLGISANVNVELDAKKILQESLDALFADLKEDDLLTKILVEISLQKLDNDKNWQLDFDFLKVFGELFFDQHKQFLDELNQNSLSDLNLFRKEVYKNLNSLKSGLIKNAELAIEIIENSGVAIADFSGGARSSLPKFFQKIKNRQFDLPTATHQKIIDEEKYGSSKANESSINTIQQIFPSLVLYYNQINQDLVHYFLWQKISETVSTLSLVNELNKKLADIKDDQQIMLISDSNRLISNHLQEQPAAFIYERIGNRYHHLFIDEFQDTSDLQWNNLYPLIENVRATNDSLMLVGDVKQSIYRWRGGNPKLMMDLVNEPDVTIENLPKNWRSAKTIVEFNNDLYRLTATMLQNPNHKIVYENSQQKTNDLENGYVQINYFEDSRNTEISYLESTLNQIEKNIQQSVENGFSLGEIVVLCRTGLQSKRIAEYLVEQNIPVISSDALLLDNSVQIQTIIALFEMIDSDYAKQSMLSFLFKLKQLELFNPEFFTDTVLNILNDGKIGLIRVLKEFNLDFECLNRPYFSLYDLVEIIVRSLNLQKNSSVYVVSFLDVVLDFTTSQSSDIRLFLEHWERIKDKVGVRSPEDLNAVKLMTIHQSKGLEFPVVILPFVDWNAKDSGLWIPIENEKIPHFYVNGTKNLELVNNAINSKIQEEKELRTLDDDNLLYVATTRAKEQLYITTKPQSKTSENFILSLLENYVFKNGGSLDEFKLGLEKRVSIPEKQEEKVENLEFVSNSWTDKIRISAESAIRWNEEDKGRQFGNLIHDLLAQIYTEKDLDIVLKRALIKGIIQEEEQEEIRLMIQNVINHPIIKSYFLNDYEILNERDFITENGIIIRPDRLAFKGNECMIIDYKTGVEQSSHYNQIKQYSAYFKSQDYENVKSYLVYLSEKVSVIEVK